MLQRRRDPRTVPDGPISTHPLFRLSHLFENRLRNLLAGRSAVAADPVRAAGSAEIRPPFRLRC